MAPRVGCSRLIQGSAKLQIKHLINIHSSFSLLHSPMLNMPAQTSTDWVLEDQKGFDSLNLVEGRPIPDLGDSDVLVKLYAASLNYRDLVIAKVSKLIKHIS